MVQPREGVSPLNPILDQFRLNIESLETTLRFLKYSRSQYVNMKTYLESFHNMNLTASIKKELNGLSTSVLISESGERDSTIRKHYLREVSNIESEIERLDGEIDNIVREVDEKKTSGERLSDLVNNLEKLDSFGTNETINEDGLPFMEIREELDDDDRVSRATVIPQSKSKEPKIQEVRDEEAKDLESIDENQDPQTKMVAAGSEELQPADENQLKRVEQLSDQLKVDESSCLYSQDVPTQELLELELIADELNEESDYSRSEESEDEMEDDMFYSMVPGNDRANDLLSQQIQSLRAGKFSSGKTESVMNDIFEHDETVSEEELSTEVLPEVKDVLHDIIPKRRATTQKKSNLKGESLKPKKSVSFAESLQIKVVDNVSDDLKRIVHEPAARVSRFKQNRLNNEPKARVVQSETFTSDVVGDVVESVNGSNSTNGMDDLNSMAKAYINGDYNDDIAVSGDVVEELSDFERINKILEERSQMQLPEVDEVDEVDEEESDSGPIVEDEIVEKESVDDNEFEVDSEMLRQEVALDYHRLRNKMMFQYGGGFKETDLEKEQIPVDKDGNVKKMSRFMAAKRRGVSGWNA